MTSSAADRPLREVLDAFSSADPTPGGGSAAALSGALGVSLLVMVASLPKTRTGTPEERASLDVARQTLIGLRDRLLDLVDRDAAAYDLVVAAFRLPKGTDEEKAARTAAVQQAFRVATEVPVETMEACRAAQLALGAVAQAGAASAASDVGVASHLISSAWFGAILNVETNIGSLKDPALAAQVTARVRAVTPPRHEGPDGPFMSSPAGVLLISAMKRFLSPTPPQGPVQP